MRALLLGFALLGACDGDCLELSAECTPQYEPTFDAVYANTLATSCSLSSCHAGSEGQGDLAMGSTAEEAYQALQGYVVPGDPSCSELMHHLEPEGLGDMPPGQVLAEEERCAIRQWIEQGAQR
jgi:hypothetical protein